MFTMYWSNRLTRAHTAYRIYQAAVNNISVNCIALRMSQWMLKNTHDLLIRRKVPQDVSCCFAETPDGLVVTSSNLAAINVVAIKETMNSYHAIDKSALTRSETKTI